LATVRPCQVSLVHCTTSSTARFNPFCLLIPRSPLQRCRFRYPGQATQRISWLVSRHLRSHILTCSIVSNQHLQPQLPLYRLFLDRVSLWIPLWRVSVPSCRGIWCTWTQPKLGMYDSCSSFQWKHFQHPLWCHLRCA